MTWLITGGAGYIGAHIVASGFNDFESVTVLDDLSSGFQDKIPKSVKNYCASLQDVNSLRQVFEHSNFEGVVHLAAKKQVSESVKRPDYYWQENVVGFQNLLDVMLENDVKNLVFSSSASVYGQPDVLAGSLITEGTPCFPINPYGETKLEGERLARKFVEEHGFKVVALRYFNVAGAGSHGLGDRFTYNLIPIVFQAIDRGEHPVVFGNDYNTLDGTCIRDYVHVLDLTDAHMAAINFVQSSESVFQAINIGTGIGVSVLEVLSVISEVIGKSVDPIIADRREGDPASLVADVHKAKHLLGWERKYDLNDMVTSAWGAWRAKVNN